MWPLLIACAASDEVEDSASTADDGATDTVPEIPLVPEWSVSDALTNAQASLDRGLPDAPSVRDLYFGLIETGGDEDCPGADQLDGARATGCTSEAGYFYAGHSVWETNDEGWHLSGDFEIATPDDRSFWMGGQVVHRTSQDYWGFQIEGTLIFEGADDWFYPGVSAVYSMSYSAQRDEVLIDGGYTASGVSFSFEDVSWRTQTEPYPDGVVAIRDPVGAWYWLEMVDHSGCGTVTFDGEAVGTGCLDLATPLRAVVDRVEMSP